MLVFFFIVLDEVLPVPTSQSDFQKFVWSPTWSIQYSPLSELLAPMWMQEFLLNEIQLQFLLRSQARSCIDSQLQEWTRRGSIYCARNKFKINYSWNHIHKYKLINRELYESEARGHSESRLPDKINMHLSRVSWKSWAISSSQIWLFNWMSSRSIKAAKESNRRSILRVYQILDIHAKSRLRRENPLKDRENKQTIEDGAVFL